MSGGLFISWQSTYHQLTEPHFPCHQCILSTGAVPADSATQIFAEQMNKVRQVRKKKSQKAGQNWEVSEVQASFVRWAPSQGAKEAACPALPHHPGRQHQGWQTRDSGTWPLCDHHYFNQQMTFLFTGVTWSPFLEPVPFTSCLVSFL